LDRVNALTTKVIKPIPNPTPKPTLPPLLSPTPALAFGLLLKRGLLVDEVDGTVGADDDLVGVYGKSVSTAAVKLGHALLKNGSQIALTALFCVLPWGLLSALSYVLMYLFEYRNTPS